LYLFFIAIIPQAVVAFDCIGTVDEVLADSTLCDGHYAYRISENAEYWICSDSSQSDSLVLTAYTAQLPVSAEFASSGTCVSDLDIDWTTHFAFQLLPLNIFQDPAEAIIASALVDLNSDGISGTGASIKWANAGLGGSDYDLDTPGGTTSNLTQGSVNGQAVIETAGGAYLEPASGQLIEANLTLIIVARMTTSSPNQFFFDAKSGSGNRLLIYSWAGDSNKFYAFASAGGPGGVGLGLSQGFSSAAHCFIIKHLASSASSFVADGLGSVVGDFGSSDFNYMSLFANFNGDGEMLSGWVGRVLIWDDGGITDDEIDLVVAKLNNDFGL
jgi:hypothetical protein